MKKRQKKYWYKSILTQQLKRGSEKGCLFIRIAYFLPLKWGGQNKHWHLSCDAWGTCCFLLHAACFLRREDARSSRSRRRHTDAPRPFSIDPPRAQLLPPYRELWKTDAMFPRIRTIEFLLVELCGASQLGSNSLFKF